MPGKLRFEELHLIGENIFIRQVKEFVPVRHEWNREQLHARLFRSLICLTMITALASRDYIGPVVSAATRYR